MSSENTFIVKSIYEAFRTRDFARFVSFLSPDLEITCPPEMPFGGIYQGIREAQTYFGRVGAYIDSYEQIEHVIDAGDRVAAVGSTYGTAKANGSSFDVPLVHLWGLQDSKVVRLEIAFDVPKMLAALNA